jgi:hypothetical protein
MTPAMVCLSAVAFGVSLGDWHSGARGAWRSFNESHRLSGSDRLPAQREQNPAHAPRWPIRSTVQVWIDPDRAPADGVDLAGRAVRTWTEAVRGFFELRMTETKADAALRVRFLDLSEAGARYGEASPRFDRSGNITSAEVFINANVFGDPLQRSVVIYLTALHELGHALGLPHTDRFEDIMYAFRRPGDGERYFGRFRRLVSRESEIGSGHATGLSSDDISALKTLYATTR